MKLIDLLNKIKNEEDIPTQIIFNKEVYMWDISERYYKRYDGDDLLEQCLIYDTVELLNAEVESIENLTEQNIINKLKQEVKQLNERVKKLEE